MIRYHLRVLPRLREALKCHPRFYGWARMMKRRLAGVAWRCLQAFRFS
jgi:hypothetical protein